MQVQKDDQHDSEEGWCFCWWRRKGLDWTMKVDGWFKSVQHSRAWGEAQLLALAGNVELRRRSRTLFSCKLVWMETATT
jgi:sensor domain CHASE-containing protein